MKERLLEIRGLSKSYRHNEVLRDITFDIGKGDLLALTGPSGAGKSTIIKLIMGMEKPEAGEIRILSKRVEKLSKRERLEWLPRKVQVVWQDPKVYLNPYYTVFEIMAEPLKIHGLETSQGIKEKVEMLRDLLKIPAYALCRRPNELNGGLCQLVALGRALALDPSLLLCDEILVNLDLSRQIQIVDILMKIAQEKTLGLLFISHDLDISRLLCSQVMVLKKGKLSFLKS